WSGVRQPCRPVRQAPASTALRGLQPFRSPCPPDEAGRQFHRGGAGLYEVQEVLPHHVALHRRVPRGDPRVELIRYDSLLLSLCWLPCPDAGVLLRAEQAAIIPHFPFGPRGSTVSGKQSQYRPASGAPRPSAIRVRLTLIRSTIWSLHVPSPSATLRPSVRDAGEDVPAYLQEDVALQG